MGRRYVCVAHRGGDKGDHRTARDEAEAGEIQHGIDASLQPEQCNDGYHPAPAPHLRRAISIQHLYVEFVCKSSCRCYMSITAICKISDCKLFSVGASR